MSTALAVFACPVCKADLRGEGESLACDSCGRSFPVVEGIPRFVELAAGAAAQVQRVFDFEHRRYRDSWYTQFHARLVEQFLEECGLPRAFFAGKRALDAGCGSGRWSYALSELGADVVGVDLTAGGPESARAAFGDRDSVTLAQADLFALPFRPESFDFVMSWGVLHHTHDTKAAFDQLVPLVKPGGTLFVMVYELESRLRAVGTNVVRRLMRRLSDERRYRACRLFVVRNGLVARALSPFLIISYLPPDSKLDPATAQFGLFDAYSPRWNHLHTHEEVVGWFSASGFEEVVVIDRPGAVRVRGRRAAGNPSVAAS
ncbi:MAG TPA: methyltransferase domain-containing protein [Gaiellaceae bacterium]|nr:methyltransferase domain-containing protein [Gaiellaceae bacterium]